MFLVCETEVTAKRNIGAKDFLLGFHWSAWFGEENEIPLMNINERLSYKLVWEAQDEWKWDFDLDETIMNIYAGKSTFVVMKHFYLLERNIVSCFLFHILIELIIENYKLNEIVYQRFHLQFLWRRVKYLEIFLPQKAKSTLCWSAFFLFFFFFFLQIF